MIGFADILTEQQFRDRLTARGSTVGAVNGGFTFSNWANKLKPQQLIVLASHPSHGKSACAMNVAIDAALRGGKRVGIFTLELSKRELLFRILASESRVPASKMQTGALTRDERRRMTRAWDRIGAAPLYIDDNASRTMPTLQEIVATARRLKYRNGLDLLVVDYIQLIGSVRGNKAETRAQEVSAVARGLKELAKELNIPIIAVSQLEADCDMRMDKRPRMTDLRVFGSLAEDADIVAFIYRAEVYQPHDGQCRGLAEVMVAKQRNGGVGTMSLIYQADITRFCDRPLICADEVPRARAVVPRSEPETL